MISAVNQAKYLPDEQAVVLVAGTEKAVVFKGPNIPGTRQVRIDFLSYDEGKVAAIAVQDVQVKIIPRGHPDAFGGSTWHTFYAVPTPNTNNRNAISLGGTLLQPNEDIDLTVLSAIGGTFRLRLERSLLGAFPV